MAHGGIRAAVAGYLEGGHARSSRVGEALASAWGAIEASRVVRPLVLPPRATVIGVGGTTLGGSYKTPLAVKLAEALAARGERVAFVGHGYRARVRFAHRVMPSDEVNEVGDDALFAARRLFPLGVAVLVGPSRQAALDLAARRASCLVVDGLLQARPQRLSCSILALDGRRPWGNGQCPPLGDLRAPPEALLAAADGVAAVHDTEQETPHGPNQLRRTATLGSPRRPLEVPDGGRGSPPHWDVKSRIAGAVDASGRLFSLGELSSSRVGVLLTVARPERVLDALACRGLFAVRFVRYGDHERPKPGELDRLLRGPGHRVDVWITTEKCATNLPSTLARAPVLALRHELELPPSLLAAIPQAR